MDIDLAAILYCAAYEGYARAEMRGRWRMVVGRRQVAVVFARGRGIERQPMRRVVELGAHVDGVRDARLKQRALAVLAVLRADIEGRRYAAVCQQWHARDVWDAPGVCPERGGADALRAEATAHGARTLAERLQQGVVS